MEQNVEIKEEPVWLEEVDAIITEVCCDVGEAELGGLAQLSQSSYSAVINMGNATSVKQENVDFGFVDVSQGPGHAVPLECGRPRDEDPLALPVCPAPHIKREMLICKEEILDIVKQEPPDPENNAMDVGQLSSTTEVDPLALPVRPAPYTKREVLNNVKQEPPDPEGTAMDVGHLSPTTGMLHSSAKSRVTTWPSMGLLCNNEDIKLLRNLADMDEQSRTSDFVVKLVRNFNKNILEDDTLPFSVYGGVSFANKELYSSEQTGLQGVNLHTYGKKKQEDVPSFASSSQHIDQVNIHSHEKLWACDQCDKRFTRHGVLTKHKTIHSGLKPYVCEVCNKRFSERSGLKTHKRIYSATNPFVCDVCDKRFTRSSHLISHKNMHSGVKPYVCDVCDKRFTQSFYLSAHKKIHSGVKPYACDVCDNRFTFSSSLLMHMKYHRGDTPFVCEVCNKRFIRLSDLTTHKNIHSGVKPYVCDVCDKRFTQRGSLTKHKCHSGVKPYGCDLCDQKFNYASTYTRHMKVHILEKRVYRQTREEGCEV